MRRAILAAMSLAFLALGTWSYYFASGEEAAFGASSLRAALLAGLAYLAYPQLEAAPRWLIAAILGSVVVVRFRPRLLWGVVPLLFVMWLLRPRPRGPADSRRK